MTLTEAIQVIFSKKASSPAQREVNSGTPDADPNPTEAQKSVGNYRKVHLNLDGFRISIENPKGSVRSGVAPDGTRWSNALACDYGDIRGTEDVDGDPVDIYLSDHPEKGAVFVIDQIDPKTKKFDEHKVMYGFDSVEDAKKAYLACYQKGWGGLGWITPVTKAEFRKWIDSSDRKTKPFHEYKSVTPIVDPIKVKAAEAAPGEYDAEHSIPEGMKKKFPIGKWVVEPCVRGPKIGKIVGWYYGGKRDNGRDYWCCWLDHTGHDGDKNRTLGLAMYGGHGDWPLPLADSEEDAEKLLVKLEEEQREKARKYFAKKQEKTAQVKEAQSVKWAQFVPINTLKWLQEKDKISPDADTRHFFDTIVPYIKSHSDTAGTPGVDYNASKFVPGFYRSVDIRKKKLPSNVMGASYRHRGVRIDHSAVGNSSTLVHELKHQQNQDGFLDYSAWQNYIPFTKTRFIQSGRSAADDRLLSDAYHFTQGDVGPYYPFADEDRLKIILRAEQGTTHAEHQFAIMRELKEKLGRNPTGEEFVDYVRAADLDKLNSWRREFVPNGYQYRADARNPSPQYCRYRRTAEEEAEKLDFPRWVDFASKSEMDKHKQQPWYNPDIFRRSTDEGDPFDKTTESGIRGGFNPKYKWIDGRIEQMREQNTKSRELELESFRRALMNVAKNKVRPGGLYQNAQNTRRGMIV